ncbi:alpha-amylase family glycosyl hydrolase [Rhodanobacter lindaniclasticus]|uniref:Alpha-amylase n=1 Tax=Rhodanobacter lindaniclasticus TaxID=75310 RepID=A0A4S3KK47_9GAMM|nr:alpha-amylase family glycosyl hydrolase [Rhodanobacter lindaniclasticus]THD09000.1 alpha-amylase [Rhodanobacter lindaniclasticus]
MSTRLRYALFGLVALLAITSPLQATSPEMSGDAPAASSGVWYEIFVRSWVDTNGDGIGDLNGVTAKLDYLQSLGVSGIWLMPINPSPSYHGYDVTDYRGINPEYGTLADFDRLLAEAHKRGIRIIMDLVINHSSSEHPWFKAARDPASPYHDWYQWSNQHTDLDAISATGSPAWHALGKQHYLGIFVDQMPDLNFDNPAVRKEMIDIGRFWLKRGVDGFRLDAAQHVYYDFESQRHDPKILAKNLAWWSEFRHGIDSVDPQAYVVGEVTRDTEAELAPWFKPLSGVFNFPLAVQLIESARSGQAGKLPALLDGTTQAYHAVTGKYGVDVPFLSNHDQERVMSQLHDNPQQMRIAAAMLLTLPGEPFIYYGEELGMRGNKPDPDLREPMRWYRDPQGTDQTHWKAFSAGDGPDITVQAQQDDPHSLLTRYRELIGWRRHIGALRDGALTTRDLGNPQLIAWELRDAHGAVLVVHNLSGSAQTIRLAAHDLQRYAGVRARTEDATTLAQGVLHLPSYGSAVLQPASASTK